MPALASKNHINPESKQLVEAIEKGDLAFIKANLNLQNIHVNLYNSLAGFSITPLFYAIYLTQVEIVRTILETKLSHSEERFIGPNHNQNTLSYSLGHYGIATSERDQYQKIILVLLKYNANVLDEDVRKTLASHCSSCKNYTIIQLVEHLIQLNELKGDKQEVSKKIAELYDKLNEPKEAIRYREGLRAYYLKTGLNQRDGLNNTEKNAYFAVKTFEKAALEHPDIAHFAYYESLIARCYLAIQSIDLNRMSILIDDMKETLDIVFAHYDKFSLDERKNSMAQLFSLLCVNLNEQTSRNLLARLMAFYEKENDIEVLQYFKNELYAIMQKNPVNTDFYKQIKRNYLQCCVRSDFSVEELTQAIREQESLGSDNVTLRKLYKSLGEKSLGLAAINAFKKAATLGDLDAFIAAIRIAVKQENLLHQVVELCHVALPTFIEMKHKTNIDEMGVIINNMREQQYLPSDIKLEIESILQAVRVCQEKFKYDEALKEVKAVDFSSLKTLDDFNKEKERIYNLFIACKSEEIKKSILIRYNLCVMACHIDYKNDYSFLEHPALFPGCLQAAARFMEAKLQCHYGSWRTNHVRSNLYLCAVVALSGSYVAAASSHFALTEKQVNAFTEKAKKYIDEQAVKKAKYAEFANWYKNIIREVSLAKRFIVYPNILLWNQAVGAEDAKIKSHLLYGMREIFNAASEALLEESLCLSITNGVPESIEIKKEPAPYLGVQQKKSVIVAEPAALLQTNIPASIYPQLQQVSVGQQQLSSTAVTAVHLQIQPSAPPAPKVIEPVKIATASVVKSLDLLTGSAPVHQEEIDWIAQLGAQQEVLPETASSVNAAAADQALAVRYRKLFEPAVAVVKKGSSATLTLA